MRSIPWHKLLLFVQNNALELNTILLNGFSHPDRFDDDGIHISCNGLDRIMREFPFILSQTIEMTVFSPTNGDAQCQIPLDTIASFIGISTFLRRK
jgi:hypothetical protein